MTGDVEAVWRGLNRKDMFILPVDETMIAAAVSDEVFSHGRDYEALGAVQRLIQRGSTLEAVVQGTRVEPYRLRITFYPDGHFGSLCTCPYAAVPCKHVVAALLHYLHQSAAVAQRPDLAEQLAALDQGQLLELVLHLLDEHPELAEAIDVHLANAPDLDEGVLAAGSRLEALVHALVPEFVPLAADYLGEEALPAPGGSPETSAFDEFAEVQEVVQALAEAGVLERALEVLGSVTVELVDRWPPASTVTAEDRTFTRAFFNQVAEAWSQLLAQGALPADMGQAWADALAAWQQTLQPYGVGDVFAPAQHMARQAAAGAAVDPSVDAS